MKRWRKPVLVTAGIAAFAIPIVVGMTNASQIQPGPPQNLSRPADIPKWEAVSIRPCPPDTPPDFVPSRRGGGPARDPLIPFVFSADRMTLNCRPVRFLIQSAYQTYLEPGMPGMSPKDDVLLGMAKRKTPTDGPAWIDSERYTIQAKAEHVTDRAMLQGPMLQTILEDRFKLKVHWEARETAIYALVVAKGGPKLKRFQEGSCVPPPAGFFTTIMLGGAPSERPPVQRYCGVGGGIRGDTGNAGLSMEGGTIDQFVKLFLSSGSRFVVDKTGLAGKFSINLEYRLEDADRQQFVGAAGRQLPEPTAPALFDALQEQLGLRLEPAKGSVEFQVIDHIERPTPN
jgi:uncharacterized protein (TIGR03435 family)